MRISFAPAGTTAPAGAVELGSSAAGAWVECDDDALIASRAELLWLGRAAYDRAVRRLAKRDLASVVALRRAAFSARLPGLAKAELYAARLRVLEAAAGAGAATPFVRSLTVLAALGGPARWKGVDDAGLGRRLLERERGLANELASPEGAAEAVAGEVDARRALEGGTTKLLTGLGHPELERAPLYVPLVRGYWVHHPPADLVATWKRDGVPAVPWRGGVIGPLRPDTADDLRAAHEVKLMFPDGHQAAGLRLSMTSAQLEVELEDREHDLRMAAHVAGLRVELATFRRNARALAKDPSVAAALAQQIAIETPLLQSALAARPAWLAGATPASVNDEAAAFAAAAELLAKLVAKAGLEWQTLALELAALAKGG